MALKSNSTFLKDPGLKLRHQMVRCHNVFEVGGILPLCRDVVGIFYNPCCVLDTIPNTSTFFSITLSLIFPGLFISLETSWYSSIFYTCFSFFFFFFFLWWWGSLVSFPYSRRPNLPKVIYSFCSIFLTSNSSSCRFVFIVKPKSFSMLPIYLSSISVESTPLCLLAVFTQCYVYSLIYFSTKTTAVTIFFFICLFLLWDNWFCYFSFRLQW